MTAPGAPSCAVSGAAPGAPSGARPGAAAGGGRRLYIYWRCPGPELAAAVPATRRLQQALRREWPGLEAELLQRADPQADARGDGTATLMEVYAHPDGVGAVVEAAIEAAAAASLAGWCRGGRHVEAFVPASAG